MLRSAGAEEALPLAHGGAHHTDSRSGRIPVAVKAAGDPLLGAGGKPAGGAGHLRRRGRDAGEGAEEDLAEGGELTWEEEERGTSRRPNWETRFQNGWTTGRLLL